MWIKLNLGHNLAPRSEAEQKGVSGQKLGIKWNISPIGKENIQGRVSHWGVFKICHSKIGVGVSDSEMKIRMYVWVIFAKTGNG